MATVHQFAPETPDLTKPPNASAAKLLDGINELPADEALRETLSTVALAWSWRAVTVQQDALAALTAQA